MKEKAFEDLKKCLSTVVYKMFINPEINQRINFDYDSQGQLIGIIAESENYPKSGDTFPIKDVYDFDKTLAKKMDICKRMNNAYFLLDDIYEDTFKVSTDFAKDCHIPNLQAMDESGRLNEEIGIKMVLDNLADSIVNQIKKEYAENKKDTFAYIHSNIYRYLYEKVNWDNANVDVEIKNNFKYFVALNVAMGVEQSIESLFKKSDNELTELLKPSMAIDNEYTYPYILVRNVSFPSHIEFDAFSKDKPYPYFICTTCSKEESSQELVNEYLSDQLGQLLDRLKNVDKFQYLVKENDDFVEENER